MAQEYRERRCVWLRKLHENLKQMSGCSKGSSIEEAKGICVVLVNDCCRVIPSARNRQKKLVRERGARRERDAMNEFSNRREFLRAAAMTGAGLALSKRLLGAPEKSVLVFTKSSGFEHAVVKRVDGKPSIMDDTVTELGNKHGFTVGVTKDGRIFDSKEFHSYAALVFFTTGDLTTLGTDGKPPMSAKGKQALLDAMHGGKGFAGVHAASDTFHTPPDTPDLANQQLPPRLHQTPYLQIPTAQSLTPA